MYDLNVVSELLEKKVSKKKLTRQLTEFLIENQPLFGLDNYDEDFRSEIYLRLMESGEKILSAFDPKTGNFFSYFYCCILSLITTQLRREAINQMNLSLIEDECIKNYEDKTSSYENLNFNNFYSAKKFHPENKLCCGETKLKLASRNDLPKDKTLLVIALKSSFYITEDQIQKLADIYNIEYEELYEIVQNLKNGLMKKQERKTVFEERRNRAYYYHKRYIHQIDKINREKDTSIHQIYLLELERKNKIQERRWKSYNEKLKNGFIHLRPSNKTIAEILGICERQVTYYLFCYKNGKELENLNEDQEESM